MYIGIEYKYFTVSNFVQKKCSDARTDSWYGVLEDLVTVYYT